MIKQKTITIHSFIKIQQIAKFNINSQFSLFLIENYGNLLNLII